MRKLSFVTTTCPPLAPTRNSFTLPPNIQDQRTCVSSWPKTYKRMGLGSMRKITHQQIAPASTGTQTNSAWPSCKLTRQSVLAAPTQKGSSRTATMNLSHFGMSCCNQKTGHGKRRDQGGGGTPPSRDAKSGKALAVWPVCIWSFTV